MHLPPSSTCSGIVNGGMTMTLFPSRSNKPWPGLWKEGLILEDPDIFYATDGSPGSTNDPRAWKLTWAAIAFKLKADGIEVVASAAGPVPAEQFVFRAEACALLFVVEHTAGDIDVTMDAKSVKTRVERRSLGRTSLDLVYPIRAQAERLHLHWIRSHKTLESHCQTFGSQSAWRWHANQAVDKLAGDHANQSRDRLWEGQLVARDADAKVVLGFLAARVATLFEYDKDQGPQVQFEGEATPDNRKGRASGFKRKSKIIRRAATMEKASPAEPPSRGREPAREKGPERGRSKGKSPAKGKGPDPAKGKGSTRPKGKDPKGAQPGRGKSQSHNPAEHSKGGKGSQDAATGKKHRSKSSKEYSQRRAGKKQRAAGQYYRWSRPLQAEQEQHRDTPPPPVPKRRGGRKEEDEKSAASSPRAKEKAATKGKEKPTKAPAHTAGQRMAVKSKAKPSPEAEEASGSPEPLAASAPSSSQAGVPPPAVNLTRAAKEKESPAFAEEEKGSPGGRALPVPDLGVNMQFTIQLKDASKEACSGRYLHAASLVYFAHQDRQGAEPGSPQKVATALEVLGLGGSRVVFRSPSNPAKCWKLSKRSQEAERDLFKVTGPWTPRHTRALGVHRVVEEGKGGTSFFASLLETELVDPLPMVNPPLIFQIFLTVCQAAKFANVRDLGRKNMGSRSMPQGMGDPPRYEVLLLDSNDWEEYGSQTTPHWPNKRRAQGLWSTVSSFSPELLEPLQQLVKQHQADLQALTQGIYNLMGKTLVKGEAEDVLEALVSTQALGLSPEGHICQYVLKQGGPHPLVPGQTWELHPLEQFQQGKLRKART
ncbi:unnamed protein product [Symbiodinium sp. CCMP2592]|nr:unnamed protein product [Symbiodinium sp. CCMP2592]